MIVTVNIHNPHVGEVHRLSTGSLVVHVGESNGVDLFFQDEMALLQFIEDIGVKFVQMKLPSAA